MIKSHKRTETETSSLLSFWDTWIAPKLFLDQLGAWISLEAGSRRGLKSFVQCWQERIMWENNGVACGLAGESDFVNNEKGFILKDNRDNPKRELDSTISLQLTDSLVRWITQREKTADATTTQKHYPPGGGTWVFFGWVCAARDSKLAPRSRKKFP